MTTSQWALILAVQALCHLASLAVLTMGFIKVSGFLRATTRRAQEQLSEAEDRALATHMAATPETQGLAHAALQDRVANGRPIYPPGDAPEYDFDGVMEQGA